MLFVAYKKTIQTANIGDKEIFLHCYFMWILSMNEEPKFSLQTSVILPPAQCLDSVLHPCPKNEASLQRGRTSGENLGDWILFLWYLPAISRDRKIFCTS